jgi:ribonuclease HI
MNKQINIYVDGGVIGPNPSPKGGTFAYIFIEGKEKRMLSGSGIVTPSEMGLDSITNNLTELLAAVNALEHFDKWNEKSDYSKIVLLTDSRITKYRMMDVPPAKSLCI